MAFLSVYYFQRKGEEAFIFIEMERATGIEEADSMDWGHYTDAKRTGTESHVFCASFFCNSITFDRELILPRNASNLR
jgi:hypothetical protein